MKRIKNKKIIFIIIFVLVISSTIAYLYSTDVFENIFVAASYKVTVVETFESPDNWVPGDTTPKTVTLKNEGTVPIKVRVSYVEEWRDSNDNLLDLEHDGERVPIINFSNEDDYIYKDGYYYYDLSLEPGKTTSSFIESVTFNPNYSGSITCVENNDSTHTCSSSDSSYEGGTYKLTLTIEGVQEDYYVQAWGLSGKVYSSTLYNVLRKETEENGLAREYTGDHQDSMDSSKTIEKIYHYYAENSTDVNQISGKNNVLFGNHCWQMIRTTDTGGVKMIYNGEAENNQCLSTRGSHVGYSGSTYVTLSNNYWYGTDFTYNSTSGVFSLSGTTEQTRWNNSTYQGLIGKYTCRSTSKTGTCQTLFLVYSYYDQNNANVIRIDSSSSYQRFGILEFNIDENSPSYVGYMHNTVYTSNSMSYTENMLTSGFFSNPNYWYADSVTWGNPISNKYNLNNPTQVSSTSDYPNLVGKYTFKNSNSSYTDTTVQYVTYVSNNSYYYIPLGNESGSTHDLSYYNYTYTYGDSYTDNGNGTYTINNPTTINRSDWYTSYTNIGSNKYMCKNAVNNTCSDLWYTLRSYDTYMTYIKVTNNFKYAKGFTWDGNKYILDNDTSVTFWDISNNTNKTSINNAHYTCWNLSGECTTISYIYSLVITTPFYINLNEGKDVEDALNEMLSSNGVNSINSTIKTGVDEWYRRNLLDYDEYIEDTIFCNDRSISSLGGWNPDGGSVDENLKFKEYSATTDISCANITDRFSVSNDKAKLTYKVGLLSSPEMNITKKYIQFSSTFYWFATPSFYDGRAEILNVYLGGLTTQPSYREYGVRPAISLIPGIEYSLGDGSMANPYIVKIN